MNHFPRMPTTAQRVFLFLQGHPSLFWRNLAAGLEAEGHRVLKVNFSAADWAFWQRPGAINFKGAYESWRPWLSEFLDREGVTDILYYADQLPYHRTARRLARGKGIASWAVEFGYLRPDWLTLEPEAMGAGSKFPRDQASLRKIADGRADPDLETSFPHAFWQEAVGEVSYNLLQTAGRPFYPLYQSDEYYSPIMDYLYWLRELARERRYKRQVAEAELAIGEAPFNLVAMQLQPDYQIRRSSHYNHLSEFLDEVISSFRSYAPSDRHLWVHRLTRGVRDRVHLIRGGNLGAYLRNSKGAIYVNSTVGLHAIQGHVPSIAMGHAVFDVEGLTHQRGLDSFWMDPDPVDPDFVPVYLRALATIQIKGSFFSADGQKHAIAEICERFSKG